MPNELKLLGVAVLIGLVHIMWAASAAQPQRGMEWNVGPRDTPVVLTGTAGRLERAGINFRETFPLFAAAVLAVLLANKTSQVTLLGAGAYVVGRAIYMPLYAFGVSYIRSFVWAISTAGIVAIVIALFTS